MARTARSATCWSAGVDLQFDVVELGCAHLGRARPGGQHRGTKYDSAGRQGGRAVASLVRAATNSILGDMLKIWPVGYDSQ